MIIIWGTKVRKDQLGEVADWCTECRAIRHFSVTNYYRIPHVYWIPLGSGSLTATARKCWACGSEFHCREMDYDRLLHVDDAQRLSPDELLRHTNSRLRLRLTAQPQLSFRPGAGEPLDEVLPVGDEEVLDAMPAEPAGPSVPAPVVTPRQLERPSGG